MAFEGLTPEECAIVHGSVHRRRYGARERIFDMGDQADALLVVESGRIRMFHCSASGEEFTICIWPAGHTLGLLSTLLDQKRIVSAESVESTVLLSFPRQKLLELMRTIPTFAINIARLAASLAKESIVSTSPLVLDPAPVRLGKVLAKLAMVDPDSSAGSALVVRGLNQEDLASMVGVTRTWLTLMLSTLESNGLIWRKRLQIGIHDLDALQKFCHTAGRKPHRA